MLTPLSKAQQWTRHLLYLEEVLVGAAPGQLELLVLALLLTQRKPVSNTHEMKRHLLESRRKPKLLCFLHENCLLRVYDLQLHLKVEPLGLHGE